VYPSKARASLISIKDGSPPARFRLLFMWRNGASRGFEFQRIKYPLVTTIVS